jgi:hypothetical protein
MPRRVLSHKLLRGPHNIISHQTSLESMNRSRSENSDNVAISVPYSKKWLAGKPVLFESPKKKTRNHRTLLSPGGLGLEIKNKSPLRGRWASPSMHSDPTTFFKFLLEFLSNVHLHPMEMSPQLHSDYYRIESYPYMRRASTSLLSSSLHCLRCPPAVL